MSVHLLRIWPCQNLIDDDRYPLSPRIVTLKEILGMLRPQPERPPPPRRYYEPPSKVRIHGGEDSMEVPVLTAIICVGGIIVGGCLTMFTNYLLQKRRERAEFRIGCRLIDSDLGESEDVISCTLELKRWWPSEVEPRTKAWEEHRHVLASYLSY